MTEALERMIPYGFGALGLNQIEAFIDPDHDRSRRMLEKTGLRIESRCAIISTRRTVRGRRALRLS